MDISAKDLDRQVSRSIYFAVALISLSIAAYPLYFWVFEGGHRADDPEVWGQFGDYVGGLLNPLIAFLAFYWLTRSVLLQRQELVRVQEELSKSALSHERQVRLSEGSARIGALGGVLASVNQDVSALRAEINLLEAKVEQLVGPNPNARPPMGIHVGLERQAQQLRASLKELIARRDGLVDRINAELDSLTASTSI
ncbi:hypothetical protein RDV84_13015 [Lysobacter yananisis]|uniref:Uncharacterized protein n=1 Tax=Lysobacter yananisis TaxID=1003114 RepID=A0ABY9PF97_9GAMM|nr:hypothetical protein [Lysobacter yananisis]WMT05720.1 hypothetical protein RDV84_13015 [Lysobacter yananisis]